ncbi:MAG: CPBP family intramembrane metalloprotease [Cyanobacteria bacterium CRU_2_1]|nr:CPBP family intramembrane metalloprotease [Cyanobacteria bacterium RU_5_0]NJR59686.1 CPBP family intramembrane metalloprotease [Cyanobacteria bacterium CRU_2_1]
MPDEIPPKPNVEPLTRIQILVAMGVTAVVLLIAARLWLLLDSSVQLLSLTWSLSDVLWGIGLGMAITVASAIVYRLWEAYRHSADYYLELVIKPLAVPDLVWLGLLPGMSEELLFRGVMLPALGLTWFGLGISSLCFGILHFSGSQHWSYVVWATTIGFVLGFSAIETGNLLVPIVAHVTTNLISSCIWKLSSE